MNYYNSLTYELRLRNYNDDEISPILAEVQEHSSQQGTSPEGAFGKASEYAKAYPERKRRLPIWYATVGLWLLGLLFGVFVFFGSNSEVVEALGPLPLVTIMTPFLLVVTVLAIILMHRLPAASKSIAQETRAY